MYLHDFRDPQPFWRHDLDRLGSRKIIGHLAIGLAIAVLRVNGFCYPTRPVPVD